MKKLKISRASIVTFLIIVVALISAAQVYTFNQINIFPGVVSHSRELIRSDEIGRESSSSKNDGVLDAYVVVDIDLLKEQIHNNKQENQVHNDEEDEVHNDEEDKVHNDKENDPIANSTEIMANHIKTELNDNA